MHFKPRMKVYGRKASEEKIISEIDSLRAGTSRRQYPVSIAEAAKVLGVSRQTIYNYLRRKETKPTKNTTGRYKLPKPIEGTYRRFNKYQQNTT